MWSMRWQLKLEPSNPRNEPQSPKHFANLSRTLGIRRTELSRALPLAKAFESC